MDEEEHSLYWLVGHLCELSRGTHSSSKIQQLAFRRT